MSTELWVALDVSDAETALSFARELKSNVDVFKVGLELFTAEGPSILYKLKDVGCKVFLDLKFHDIPNTVAGAVRNATRAGVDYLDVHASGGIVMMQAAKDAAHEEAFKMGLAAPPKILAITVLTSMDDKALRQLHIENTSDSLVKNWAVVAKKIGLDGVVNSLHEVKSIREVCGSEFLSVAPGIRPVGNAVKDDQRRVGTPKDAVAYGASAIVVGRPILRAKDPVAAAYEIKKELNIAIDR